MSKTLVERVEEHFDNVTDEEFERNLNEARLGSKNENTALEEAVKRVDEYLDALRKEAVLREAVKAGFKLAGFCDTCGFWGTRGSTDAEKRPCMNGRTPIKGFMTTKGFGCTEHSEVGK